MADGIDPLYVFIISTALVISGIIGTWVWNIRVRSDRRSVEAKQQAVETQRLAGEVERLAREKGVSERGVAKELADSSATVAASVKQDMREHISQLIDNLKRDIELQRERIQGVMDLRGMKIDQIRKDFEDHITTQNLINEKNLKAIEMIQTMLWGDQAKSTPPYMLGQEETQEHKDEPEKGVFAGKE